MSTVAKKVLMGSGAVESAYEIEQSAIFNGDAGLYRTPSSTGNRRTWTLSFWAKRNLLGGWQNIIGGQHNTPASYVYFNADNQIAVHEYQNGVPTNYYTETTRVLRDVSAWYHIVVNFDSTQGTAANRMKIWINGVQETSFDVLISPSQNFQTQHNLASIPQYVGRNYTSNDFFKGQLAEMHWLDGVTKPASNFGETNDDTGQWIPKEYVGGSYGTNGFYLKFVSGAIGTDSSGNGNTHTVQSLANSDIVPDSPTNNFATLNSLFTASANNTYSEGNLKTVCPNSTKGLCVATIVPTAGKYYAEFKTTAGFGDYPVVGVFDVSSATTTSQTVPGVSTKNIGYYAYNGQILAGPSGTVLDTVASWAVNDIIAVAIDYDNSTVKWYKNNTLVFTKSSADLKDVTFAFSGTSGSSGYTIEANFGQKTLAYTPPSGYVALSTANLPDPAIALPTDHFNTKLYVGNGSIQTISGVGFQAGLTWIKNRTAADWFALTDSNRGVQKTLSSYGNNSDGTDTGPISGYEFTYSDGLTAFNSDGFALGAKNEFNTNNEYFVSWNWKTGSNASNTDGEITTTVSANQTAGFSIMTYAGTGNSKTIGHGLSAAPTLILIKKRAGGTGATAGPAKGGNWVVGASAIDPNWTGGFYLNHTGSYYNADGSATNYFWNGAPTSSVIKLKSDWFVNGVSTTYVAYAFHDVPGYSKIGTYTGNGNASGTFINTGFKPAWVMVKLTSAADLNWNIFDNKRDVDNGAFAFLAANTTAAEGDQVTLDLLSNGFKIRNAGDYVNSNAATYLYMAFAESPFKTSNAR
jgi:hypothetical protein